ncbi:hypothetical protein ACFQ51_50170 [Streptomyces kaempferi]
MHVVEAVGDDGGLADEAEFAVAGLDPFGGDVAASGGDDEVLLASGDAQVAVVVDLGEVAGVQAALVVDDDAGGVLAGVARRTGRCCG